MAQAVLEPRKETLMRGWPVSPPKPPTKTATQLALDRQLKVHDQIAITAACTKIPPPLLEQLTVGGRIIAPMLEEGGQRLTLITKQADDTTREELCDVLYVRLQRQYAT